MALIQLKVNSKIGLLYFVSSESGLRGLFWKPQNVPMVMQIKGHSPEMKNLKLAIDEVSEFLDGKRKKFNMALDIKGTDFQKKVWNELRKIPYGKTVSYKEIAERVGTNGIRAVGSANGKNPLCIVVPCHRVIASGGGLGGYSGGLIVKKKLLTLEQVGNLPT